MKSIEAKECSSQCCSALSEVEMRSKPDQTGSEAHRVPAVSVGFEQASPDSVYICQQERLNQKVKQIIIISLGCTIAQVEKVRNNCATIHFLQKKLANHFTEL